MTTETTTTAATAKRSTGKTIARRLALAVAYFVTWVLSLIPATWAVGGLGWHAIPSVRYHYYLSDLLLAQMSYGMGWPQIWVIAALIAFTVGRAYFPR
ncbi:hypothetical protein [Pseudomonas benzopyrenica]|uniref:hypothetical protein n=1 Tax=Pseudomonas benzopyrenica TaxID=2993566 RepID=UPI003F18BB81